MMRVLSIMSAPGPRPVQSSVLLLHVECSISHGKPVSMQKLPFTFGLTSPRLVAAKAPTNLPVPGRVPGGLSAA